MNRSRKEGHNAASIVDAAALQSEMTKRFGLTVAPLPGRKRRTTTSTTTKTTSQHCPSCGFSMEDGDSMEYCHRCGYGGISRDGSVGATGTGPSLAERRGLTLPLAASSSSSFRIKVEVMKPMDWYLMECHLAKKRDPDTRCPICMEVFNRGEEVLLSCGHIFHQVCLRSFENFMRTTELSCPICRTKSYQKKLTKLGHQALERVSAGKIQALARGWLARKKFKIALRRYYRSGHGNEKLRTKHFHTECAEMTEKMDRTLQHRVAQVDNMMRSMDRTLLEGRQLDELFEQMLRQREQSSSNSASINPPSAPMAASVNNSKAPTKVSVDNGELIVYEGEEYCALTNGCWKASIYSVLQTLKSSLDLLK
eukprot:gene9490-10481_t